jgi:adenine/guanine phosphoribosyltransferase-like PRPP-binding protein
MLVLPITEQAKKQEWDKIITVAHNNGFPTQAIHSLKKKAMAKQKKKLQPK